MIVRIMYAWPFDVIAYLLRIGKHLPANKCTHDPVHRVFQ